MNLYQKYKENNLVKVPLTALAIGDILVLAVSAEYFVEYFLDIKRKLKDKWSNVYIFELSNGWVGYIPTKKAFSFKDGAYEVQFLESSKLCDDAGVLIEEELLKMADKLFTNK